MGAGSALSRSENRLFTSFMSTVMTNNRAISMKEGTVLGVIGGATVLAIVGFTWSGWHIDSNRKLAKQRADAAGVVALMPLRVAMFDASGDALVRLAASKKIT